MDKEQDTVISGWVASDADGCVWTYINKPKRSNNHFWVGELVDIQLPRYLFPDLTWESDPEEVEIIIKRKKK